MNKYYLANTANVQTHTSVNKTNTLSSQSNANCNSTDWTEDAAIFYRIKEPASQTYQRKPLICVCIWFSLSPVRVKHWALHCKDPRIRLSKGRAVLSVDHEVSWSQISTLCSSRLRPCRHAWRKALWAQCRVMFSLLYIYLLPIISLVI